MKEAKEIWILDDIDTDCDDISYSFVHKDRLNESIDLTDCEDMVQDLLDKGMKVGDEIEVDLIFPKDEEEASDYTMGFDWEEGMYIIVNYRLIREAV